MAVAHDASTARTLNGVASDSWTHTPVGTPDCAIVRVCWSALADSTATVTYGGAAMTSIGLAHNAAFGSSVNGKAQIFRLKNPASGPQTVALTFSTGSSFGGACSTTLTGVNQGTTEGSPLTSTPTNATADTITITDAASGDYVLSAIALDTGATVIAPGDTQRLNTTQTGYSAGASDAAGAASVAMDWSWTGTTPIAHVAIAIKQAGGGGGGGAFIVNAMGL